MCQRCTICNWPMRPPLLQVLLLLTHVCFSDCFISTLLLLHSFCHLGAY